MKPLAIHSVAHAVVLASSLIAAFAPARAQAPADAGLGVVDFRYGPAWWQTAICLPDDPDKILVGKEGQVLLDFGGGGMRNFGTALQPETVAGAKWVRQQTTTARVPTVQTRKSDGAIDVLEEAFVVAPRAETQAPQAPITRTDGQTRLTDWTKPARDCAVAFRGVDVAYGGAPIPLALIVPKGAERTVVFGLCEGWHKTPGQRPLILNVEGGEPRTVDPVTDFGPNQPGLYKLSARDANGDGVIDIRVATPEKSPDRNAILNALWAFEGAPPADESILSGAATSGVFYVGTTLPPRRVVVLVTMKNTSPSEATCRPALRILSTEPVRLSDQGDEVIVGASSRVRATAPATASLSIEDANKLVVLPKMALKPGESRQVAWVVDRNTSSPTAAPSTDEAADLRTATQAWWQHADLPFETIQVPDPSIQEMLESCVRNIWQAREIKKGLPAFHVGPTVYRGLWVVDGSFLLESAAILGRGQDARAGVEYLLSHQKPDGSFELISKFWKENGIVLWAATRHAVLTQDKDWLKSHWPAIQRVVAAIHRMRVEASQDPAALNFGLLPGGEVDGGISNKDKLEYSNTYWCLAGLKAAIAAAHWLGDEDSAHDWQKEYDDFYAAYRKAAARDTLHDSEGNAYVPTMIGNVDGHVPQRGQWAFCHAVYPGMVFPTDDPLLRGQLAMLRATKLEGTVFDTGWMRQGIWTYFASFYGHAMLWQGDGREAARVLYDFARHAAPTRVWREEQKPVGKGSDEVGDMPHNWASAEFIRLCTHLIELDRGDELHLLEGFPREWAAPGKVTKLNGVLTPFGPLHLEVRVTENGKAAHLTLKKLSGRSPARIVVHLDGLTGTARTVDLPTDHDVEQVFTR